MGTTESIFYEEEGEHEHDEKDDVSTATPHRSVQQRAPRTPPPPLASTARRRNTQQLSERRPLLTLNTSIMGLPQAGKQTLLHRLRGKDPFSAVREYQSAAVVPYQSPRPVEDRIQLHVQIRRRGDEKDMQQQKTDLVILLIDPRNDRERIEQSVSEAIHSLWNKIQHETDKPFCLCILINFWDKLYKSETKQRKTKVTESDVQQMTLLALQGLSTGVEPSRLHLQCTTTSLFNCYGLGILHFFMYQSYLLHKQWQLQNTLHSIQQSLKQSRESGPQVVPYDAYLKQLRNPPPAPEQLKETAAKAPSQDSNKTHGSRRAVVIPVEPSKPAALSQSNAEASRKALEAFLADDDDEDEVLPKQHSVYDSDDDSEVFFDESGQRQIAGQDHDRMKTTTKISAPPETSPSETAQGSDEASESNDSDSKTSRGAGKRLQRATTDETDNDHVSQSGQTKTDIEDTDDDSHNDVSKEYFSREHSDDESSRSNSPVVATEAVERISPDDGVLNEKIDEEPVKIEEKLDSHSSGSDHGSIQNENVERTKDVEKDDGNVITTENDEMDTAEVSGDNPTGNDIILETEDEADKSEFFVEEDVEERNDASKPSYESIPDASTEEITSSPQNPPKHSPASSAEFPKDSVTDATRPSQSSNMSPAVLAAIAAAQQEAEAMLQQQLSQEKETRKADKKPKKEKKKKEKKKKEVKAEKEGEQSDQ